MTAEQLVDFEMDCAADVIEVDDRVEAFLGRSEPESMTILEALPIEMPNIAKARLPKTYSRARAALETCAKIDECKDWADKAEAMASYARQSGDVELRRMADRIQARALDRCRELLRQIPTSPGGRPSNEIKGLKTTLPGQSSFSPRTRAIENAGMSEHQAYAALAINGIPRPQFEELVEAAEPPTAKKLAEIGRKKRKRPLLDLGARTPKEFAAATDLIGLIDDFVRESKAINLPIALRGCEENERRKLSSGIKSACQWLKSLQATMSD